MITKALADMLRRAETWPAAEQDELAEMMREMEKARHEPAYQATEAELAGIDRGLADMRAGRVVSTASVEAIFRRHRAA